MPRRLRLLLLCLACAVPACGTDAPADIRGVGGEHSGLLLATTAEGAFLFARRVDSP